MMNPNIRPATAADVPARFPQVPARPADSRPDSFRAGARKYTNAEIAALGADPEKSFRVWADIDGPVRGYGLGRRRDEGGPGGPLRARRPLYLDDLGVEASARGRGIGEALYAALKAEARARGGVALTLNLWVGNGEAARFYERRGRRPLKTLREERWDD